MYRVVVCGQGRSFPTDGISRMTPQRPAWKGKPYMVLEVGVARQQAGDHETRAETERVVSPLLPFLSARLKGRAPCRLESENACSFPSFPSPP
ncbi:hypothetical protein SRHO_G00133920 [Serrasalmus rhombeus]